MAFAQYSANFRNANGNTKPFDPRRTAAWSKTKMCKFFPLGMCCQGSDCMYAHDESELQPLPDLARTKICRSLVATGTCSDPSCKFAHTRDELKGATPDVRRSRGPCRFWLRGNCVLGERCTHAHEHMPEWEDAPFQPQSCTPCNSTFGAPGVWQTNGANAFPNSDAEGQMVFAPQWPGMMAVPIAFAASPQQGLPASLPLESRAPPHMADYANQNDFGDSPLPSPRAASPLAEPKLAEKCACGNAFLKDCRFCRMCGNKRLLEPITEQCHCGTAFLQDALFCNCCGTKRPTKEQLDEDRETCDGEDTTEMGSDSASNSDAHSERDSMNSSSRAQVFSVDSSKDNSDEDCAKREAMCTR